MYSRLIVRYTSSHSTTGSHQKSHCPTIPDCRDTSEQSFRCPPQIGDLAPNQVLSEV